MKPLQLTKLLICGLAASAIFITNCSKPASRSVKAQMNNKQNVVQQNLVPCTDKSLSLISQRQDLLVALSQIIAEAGIKELDAAQKANLQNKIEELGPLSNSIASEIKSIKSGGGKVPTGCVQSITDSDKKISHTISEIRSKDMDFAKKVQKITKKTNSIIEGDSKRDFNREQNAGNEDEQDPSKVDDKNKDDKSIKEGSTITIGEELAELLNSPNLFKEAVILNDKIDIGDKAEELIEKQNDDIRDEFCFVGDVIGNYEKENKLKVVAMGIKKNEQQKSTLVKLVLVGQPDRISNLTCRLNTEEQSAEDKISKILNKFLK